MIDVLQAYQEVALSWLGEVEPTSAKDFQAILLHSMKLFMGWGAIQRTLKTIGDRPRQLAECEALIRTKGLIVPFLPSQLLLSYYVEDFGQERLFQELQFAVVRGYPMSEVSAHLARFTQNQLRQRWEANPALEILTTLPTHPALQSAPESATIRHQEPPQSTPIHQQPILVAAAEVVEPSITLDSAPTSETVSQPAPQFARPSTEPGQDVFQFLLSLTQAPLQPTIFVGPPGSGKGTAAAIALRLGKQRNGLNAWVFNIKAQLSEAGYWDEAQHHFLKNRLTCTRIYEDLVEVLDQFAKEADRRGGNPNQNHPPFVLLLEEVNALVGIFTTGQKAAFKGKITALASLLRGVNMAVWLSGQSINLEELGLGSRTNRAMFTTIVTVGADREAVVPICELLGVEFDPASLGPSERYWLTSKGTYLAPPPFPVRQYASWSEVANLVDMRTNATPQQPQPQGPTDEELWADYQQWNANGGSDRQWKLNTWGKEAGSYHQKLEKLKAKFGGTSETVSEPVAA